MPVLVAKELAKSFGTTPVLTAVSLAIETGERTGLVGINGGGKSTLGRILAGVIEPDRGEITVGRDVRVGYLAQDPDLEPGLSCHAAASEGLAAWSAAKQRYQDATAAIETGDGDLGALVTQQSAAAEAIEHLGGWDRDHEVESYLGHLGIRNPQALVDELSGGERRRVALARLLVARPTLAILDEPTNHLDIDTIDWLERHFVERFDGALLLITHDRYLLDRVAQRTFELADGTLFAYDGNYEYFLQAKAERMAHAERTEANRRNFLRRELEWLRRQPKARTGKSKARIARIENVQAEAGGPSAERPPDLSAYTKRLGRTVLSIRDLHLQLGEARIDGLTLELSPGDRIGVIGPNGSGKTTLLRAIVGDLAPSSGSIVTGKNSTLVYLDQERTGLDDRHTVYEAVSAGRSHIEVGGETIELRTHLRRFGFDSTQSRQKVGTLSGGQRARAALAKVLSEPGNVLLLDEPSNDLDVATLGALESMLVDYPGAAIIVTHDRYLLDRVATSILAFEGGPVPVRHVGNYTAYRDRTASSQQNEPALPKSDPKPGAASRPAAVAKPRPGLSYAERKELDGLMERVDAADQAVTRLETQLGDPAVYSDGGGAAADLQGQLREAKAAAAALLHRWEELETRREQADAG